MSMAGCQAINKHQPLSPVNNTPLVVDEAMQIRDWDRSTNYYANGATVAGGTGYCWETADWVKEGDRKLTDAPVAVLNFVSMPVGLFVNSPFEKQVVHGEIVPPTYTGQPPLPGHPRASYGGAVEPTMESPAPTEPPAPPAPPAPVEPGTPPPAPPAVETPAAPAPGAEAPGLAPAPTPPPAPSDTPTTPSPSDTPAPAPTPAPPPTAESAPPAAPATPEPPAPSSVPAPPTEPLNK
jgi:hypothetical protein